MSLLDDLKGKLIVSCQALEDEPLYSSFIMSKMAKAACMGGASAIRAQGVEDIKAIKEEVDLPIIGLIKRDYTDSEIYITPSLKEIEELISVGCDVIALDATHRVRPNGDTLEDMLAKIKSANIISMADISTVEEAIAAEKMGFDCISTTLSGYTPYSTQSPSVDIDLISELSNILTVPLVAEGKIHYPHQLTEAYAAGADLCVVGGAITRPLEITQRFMEVLKK